MKKIIVLSLILAFQYVFALGNFTSTKTYADSYLNRTPYSRFGNNFSNNTSINNRSNGITTIQRTNSGIVPGYQRGTISQNAHYQQMPPIPPQHIQHVNTYPQHHIQYVGGQPILTNGVHVINQPQVYTQTYYPNTGYIQTTSNYTPYYQNTYIPPRVYTTTSTSTYYPVSTTYINNGNGITGTITTEKRYTSTWRNNLNRFLSW